MDLKLFLFNKAQLLLKYAVAQNTLHIFLNEHGLLIGKLLKSALQFLAVLALLFGCQVELFSDVALQLLNLVTVETVRVHVKSKPSFKLIAVVITTCSIKAIGWILAFSQTACQLEA